MIINLHLVLFPFQIRFFYRRHFRGGYEPNEFISPVVCFLKAVKLLYKAFILFDNVRYPVKPVFISPVILFQKQRLSIVSKFSSLY